MRITVVGQSTIAVSAASASRIGQGAKTTTTWALPVFLIPFQGPVGSLQDNLHFRAITTDISVSLQIRRFGEPFRLCNGSGEVIYLQFVPVNFEV